MPRLAPQMNGNPAVIEQRVTLGDFERRIARKAIEGERAKDYATAINQLILPLGVASIGVGLGFGMYCIGRAIDNFSLAWNGGSFEKLKDGGDAVIQGSKGLNPDGSYQTFLCVQSPTREGRVVVNTWLDGWWLLGGISGTFFSLIGWLGSQTGEVWIPVYGNFNKDAKRVEELSPGWLPKSQWEEVNLGYTYMGGEQKPDYWQPPPFEGEPRTARESIWSINGWTQDEWLEHGSPITELWMEYVRANPNDFDVQYWENAYALQEAWGQEDGPFPEWVEAGMFDVPDLTDYDGDGWPG